MTAGRHSKGSHAEFMGLLTPVATSAYGLARRLARSDADAEDLVQEAALRAFAKFDTFEKGTNFRGWFLRILTNCFNMKWRKQRREAAVADPDQAPALYMFRQSYAHGLLDRTEDPAHAILSKLDGERVTEAIRGIPEEYRVVCALYFLEDMTYQQIAEHLELPVGTVRSRLHRGRRMLQKRLWQFAQDDGIVKTVQAGASG